MLTEAQLAERKTYIGSSDAKAVASGDIVEWDNLAATYLNALVKAWTAPPNPLL